jgi:hypothetical protein
MRRFRLALGLSLVWTSLAFTAAASKTFPEALRQKLELPEIAGPGMGCQLCHRDDNGGLMTATKPFARTLIQSGAQGANVPSLLSALTQVEADGADSDHDGTADIAELKAGTDPNTASGAGGSPSESETDDIPLPQTGCTLALGTTHGSAWTLLGVALFLLVRRRPAQRSR